MRVNPDFLENQKLCFLKKSRKNDVWHALLSFQGTRPRSLAIPRRGAVPPATTRKSPSRDGPSSLANPPWPRQRKTRYTILPRGGRLSQRRDPWKEQHPCGGTEYRSRSSRCQDNSKGHGNPREFELFRSPNCTEISAAAGRFFPGSRARGQSLRDRPCAPPRGCEPTTSPPYRLERRGPSSAG